MFKLSTNTQRRRRVNVLGFVIPSPVVVAIEYDGYPSPPSPSPATDGPFFTNTVVSKSLAMAVILVTSCVWIIALCLKLCSALCAACRASSKVRTATTGSMGIICSSRTNGWFASVCEKSILAADPTDVFIPLLLTTMCSTFVGLLVVSIYQRINLFQRAFLIMFGVIAALVAALFATIIGMENEQMQHFCRLLTACLILGAIMIFICSGWRKRLNVYNSFIEGAKGGFNVAVSLIPYCVAILAAVGVFKASGSLQLLQDGFRSVVDWIGINSDFVDALPVALMKPLNGSGARGMMLECFASHGPDSFVGHLASVLQGSTDTTFYILAIYFGSVGIKKYRHSVTCGLLADLAGMIAAVCFSYFFFA